MPEKDKTASKVAELFEKQKRELTDQLLKEVKAEAQNGMNAVIAHYARFEKLVIGIGTIFACLAAFLTYKTFEDIPNKINTTVTERVNTTVTKFEGEIGKRIEKSEQATEKEIERTKQMADKTIRDAADNAKQRFDLFEATLKTRIEDFSRETQREFFRMKDEERAAEKRSQAREGEQIIAIQRLTNSLSLLQGNAESIVKDYTKKVENEIADNRKKLKEDKDKYDEELKKAIANSEDRLSREVTNLTTKATSDFKKKSDEYFAKTFGDTMRDSARELRVSYIKTLLSIMRDDDAEFIHMSLDVREKLSNEEILHVFERLERAGPKLIASVAVSNNIVNTLTNQQLYPEQLVDVAARIGVINKYRLAIETVAGWLGGANTANRGLRIVNDLASGDGARSFAPGSSDGSISARVSAIVNNFSAPLAKLLSSNQITDPKTKKLAAITLSKLSDHLSAVERRDFISWLSTEESEDFWAEAQLTFANIEVLKAYERVLEKASIIDGEFRQEIGSNMAKYIAIHFSELNLNTEDMAKYERLGKRVNSAELVKCAELLRFVLRYPASKRIELKSVLSESSKPTKYEVKVGTNTWEIAQTPGFSGSVSIKNNTASSEASGQSVKLEIAKTTEIKSFRVMFNALLSLRYGKDEMQKIGYYYFTQSNVGGRRFLILQDAEIER